SASHSTTGPPMLHQARPGMTKKTANSPDAPHPLLALSGVSKSFPGVRALSKVSLELFPGQVTALVGENGAGKSTLVKILTGIYQPDEGTIRLGEREVSFSSAY